MEKSALISPCGKFRFHLARTWSDQSPLLFVMLNPSTADGMEDDHTIRKCMGFATRLGFGSIEVVNLFAYRATNPADLKRAGYPCGVGNSTAVCLSASSVEARGGLVVCAWGANARCRDEPRQCIEALQLRGIVPHALRLLADGVPEHPLMLPYSCRPITLSATASRSEGTSRYG